MSVLSLKYALVALCRRKSSSGGIGRREDSENLIYGCYALVAESVDALDLKSNRGSPSVPVQVWPRAF